MLGLLGTVLGMISAFGTIALLGTSDARVVASGIFEALVTTAGGLLIGVAAVACHTHLVRRAERITMQIEAVAAALLDLGRSSSARSPAAAASSAVPIAGEPRPTRLSTQAG
jgi:biopolymer transport protein ExbB